MAKKKRKLEKEHYLATALFLVGLVFLVESVAVAYLATQLPESVIGTGTLVWGYAALKFIAAVATIGGSVYTTKKK